MQSLRSRLPAFHLGWFLAAPNLALWTVGFADKEPWSPFAVAAIYANPPAWDAPLFIAARALQVPPLESPLVGVLMTLNIPAFVLSFPFAYLFRHLFPVSAQHSLSYVYAVVLACLTTVQWLLIARFLSWSRRKVFATFRSAAQPRHAADSLRSPLMPDVRTRVRISCAH